MTSTTNAASTAAIRSGSRLMRSAAVLGLATATMALSFSGAWFTDTNAVNSAAITTGTLTMTAPTSIDFNLTDMAPGDESNRAIALRNDGSLELRYDMTTAATNTDAKGLAAKINAVVYPESREATVNSTCEADYATASAYTAPLPLASGALGSLAITDRVVAGTTDELLCIVVQLPGVGTGNEFQDATTTVTFTFNSEQTANNAVA